MSRMPKLIFAYIFIFIGFLSSSANAAVSIEAKYSDTANIFDILDQVSNWWEGFCEGEYQKYWSEKFGISEEDKQLFEKYKKIREKYYSDPDQAEKDPLKNRNGFFSTQGSITADPIAEAFYSSDNLEESYQKLSKVLSNEDLVFLRQYHEAVAIGQLLYLKKIDPKRLDLGASAYNDPWISTYGKLLFPIVETHICRTIC